jgi:S-DNA-T family DNA segregation ATPase FtsK/SpoIIIE
VIAEEKVEKATLSAPRAGNYQFPPIDLLQSPPNQAMLPEDHQAMALALVQTLSQFGVEVAPGDIYTGPVITRYEVIPAPGVRVERIANLDKNIALALKATSVRILAPVPGKGCVGVEIPNRHPSPVCLRDIIESRAWSQSGAEIPLVLGKEVTGKPIVADLTKMPHLLIAGSTGSGKTVCINAIIASLLYHASPQELRFLMVDPKIVEMQMYNSLPHMLIPVVTEPKKVPAALKWLIAEMEQRYQIFAQVGVRNIAGFNAKVLKNQEEAEKEREKAAALEAELSAEERVALQHLENEAPESPQVEIPKTKLPYIVCIIDELADLMMVAPADIETCIARLAQLARAAGIHLIIATQRPSVNVITGVIKANLPSRIAFKVASKVDSRTILDGGGADNLIGRGDMLFVPPGTASTLRAQGALVSDEEIHGLVEFLKVNGKPQFEASIQKQMEAPGAGDSAANSHLSSEDELMPQALEILQNSNKPSASLLQRRLRIGYNRAARMVDFLVAEGYLEKGDTSLEEED